MNHWNFLRLQDIQSKPCCHTIRDWMLKVEEKTLLTNRIKNIEQKKYLKKLIDFKQLL